MSRWRHKIKAVIFDNDGVVIDSLQIYRNSICEVIGTNFPPSLIDKIKGRSDMDVCRIAVKELNLPMSIDEFAQRRHNVLMRELPKSELIPGAEKLIRKFKDMKLPIALATSGNCAGQIAKATNHQELYSLFDVIVCGDEVSEAKPSPEIFQVTAEKLGNIQPENIIVIDDAPNGIIAANKAKMASIMLFNGDANYQSDDAKPFMKIDSLDDFDFSAFDFVK